MSDDRFLVTGANGFIGRHVVAELRRRSARVTTIDHRWQANELSALVSMADPTIVIHLGWYTNPADYLTNVSENAASINATLELATALESNCSAHLVAAGTSAEYAPSDQPMPESHPLRPTTIYGSAKALAGAMLTLDSGFTSSVTWARLFNVIGPGEHPDRVVPKALRSLLLNQPMPLSSGEQIRDYVDVRDVARALVELGQARVQGSVNIASGVGTSLRTLLMLATEIAGDPSVLRFGDLDPGGVPVNQSVGCSSLLRSTIGWKSRYRLKDTLRDMFESQRRSLNDKEST